MTKNSKSVDPPTPSKIGDRLQTPSPVRSEGFWAWLRSLFGYSRVNRHLQDKAELGTESARAEARSMMVNLLEFAGMRVDDVMVPRVDIVAIEEEATLHELMLRFAEANHSRLPVYRETLDDLIVMVHIKDLLAWMGKNFTQKKRRRSTKTPE